MTEYTPIIAGLGVLGALAHLRYLLGAKHKIIGDIVLTFGALFALAMFGAFYIVTVAPKHDPGLRYIGLGESYENKAIDKSSLVDAKKAVYYYKKAYVYDKTHNKTSKSGLEDDQRWLRDAQKQVKKLSGD